MKYRTRVKWPSRWVEVSKDLRLATFVGMLAGNGWRVRWNHRVGAIEVYR